MALSANTMGCVHGASESAAQCGRRNYCPVVAVCKAVGNVHSADSSADSLRPNTSRSDDSPRHPTSRFRPSGGAVRRRT
jgi:hypothetical protein